jgi:lipoprotein-releasing system ATP-binding protein
MTIDYKDNNNTILLDVTSISKRYHDGDLDVTVLDEISLRVHESDQIAIVGASGSGKSTLLQLLAGLDSTNDGQIKLYGDVLSEVSSQQADKLRNMHLGFIYQFHHLLPEFTALENVMMPLMVRAMSVDKVRQQGSDMLVTMGLENRLNHKPSELSGGERQRVAIARALVTQPKLILADEPTGNLDRKTAMQVFDQMMELNQALNTALIMVTHDLTLAQRMTDIYELEDGGLKLTAQ